MNNTNTSISDNIKYPELCSLALSNSNIFNNFKSNTIYNEILEHVTFQEGVEYIQQFNYNNKIIKNIEKFKINDLKGSPRCYNYENIGDFSPTTLRYIKILNDLSQLDLDNKHIVEIGAGYGGQYTVLRQIFTPKKYTFIDLEPVIKLIEKYVTELNLTDILLEYINGTLLSKTIQSDLVISNYAFSECSKSIQDLYIEKIINHTKHCYMLYNNMNGYTHDEFISKVGRANIKVSKEIPCTHPKNVIVSW